MPDPAGENIVESNKFSICIVSLPSGKIYWEIYYDLQFKLKSLHALCFLSKDIFYTLWYRSLLVKILLFSSAKSLDILILLFVHGLSSFSSGVCSSMLFLRKAQGGKSCAQTECFILVVFRLIPFHVSPDLGLLWVETINAVFGTQKIPQLILQVLVCKEPWTSFPSDDHFLLLSYTIPQLLFNLYRETWRLTELSHLILITSGAEENTRIFLADFAQNKVKCSVCI